MYSVCLFIEIWPNLSDQSPNWELAPLCLLIETSFVLHLIVSLQVCTFIHSSRSSITSASGISVNSASSMDSLDSVLHSSESDAQRPTLVPSAGAGHPSLEVRFHFEHWIYISQSWPIISDIVKIAINPFFPVKRKQMSGCCYIQHKWFQQPGHKCHFTFGKNDK